MFHQEDGAVEMKDNDVLRIDAGDVLSFVNNTGDSTKIYQAGESFVIQPQSTVEYTQIYSDVYIDGDTLILNEMTKAKKAHNVFYDEVSGVLTYGDTTITAAEVDGSVTNEGSLTVVDPGANKSAIRSNTSGSTDVTIEGGDNITVTENTGTGTITVATKQTTAINTTMVATATFSFNDATTYYFGASQVGFSTTETISRSIIIPHDGTITLGQFVTTTVAAGSSQDWSVYLRLNNTTDYLIETIQSGGNVEIWRNDGLSIAVSEGDALCWKMVTPTWTTNPQIRGNTGCHGTMIITY
jgi:hypothetical protein